MMGSDKFYPEEKPVHRVTVDGFWIDKYQVTNKEFSDFVSATKYTTVAERPLNPAEFPNVPEEDLAPGSMVFGKTLKCFQWYQSITSANMFVTIDSR